MKNSAITPVIKSRSVGRRDFMFSLTTILMGISCTPMKLLILHTGHEKDVNKVIFAFMAAVVPEIDGQYNYGIKYFFDPEYPFYTYLSIFVHDLNTNTGKKYGINRFERLTLSQQQNLIRERSEDPLMKNLYLGAIWFTQVIIFTGMAHPEYRSTPLNFDGAYSRQNYSYSNPGDFLGNSMTDDGNLI